MKVRLLLIDPQNGYNPHNVIDIQHRHLFSGFNWQLYRGYMTEIHAFLSSKCLILYREGLGTSLLIMGLATIDPHSQKECTKIHKIPKFGANQASFD